MDLYSPRMRSRSPAALLRYAITLAVSVAVAWGIWRCQEPGLNVYEDLPLVYPPTYTNTHTTEHGWPTPWLVRRETIDLFGRTPPSNSYTPQFRELTWNLIAWASILACSAYTIWRATRRRPQLDLSTIFWATVAVAVLLCLWRVEEAAYVVHNPYPQTSRAYEVAEQIRIASVINRRTPTEPLLRLLQCPASVTSLVLFGLFCVLLTVNLCLESLFRLAWRHGAFYRAIARQNSGKLG